MRDVRLLAFGFAIAVGWSGLQAAEGQPQQDFTGDTDYQSFCSSCHGTSGKGDGVLAGSLRTRPADLTGLKGKNDGVFPADRVLKIVSDGHESAGMPAWADVFAKSQQSAGRDAARVRVEALVRYLETLQPKR